VLRFLLTPVTVVRTLLATPVKLAGGAVGR
jgi:hypothetical protein